MIKINLSKTMRYFRVFAFNYEIFYKNGNLIIFVTC